MGSIFIIRHAEKPDGQTLGVDETGQTDGESLIPRGWQRAGALAAFFGAPNGLPLPDRIYAAAPDKERLAPHDKIGSNSERPLETVTPLAAKLAIAPDLTFTRGDESDLVGAVATLAGVTLVCWQHEAIPAIARLILGAGAAIPDPWPGDRFDMVWRFDRDAAGWRFSQVCQRLLAGDGAAPIA